MTQNLALASHLETLSLERILEDSHTKISEVFNDDNKIKEFFNRAKRPILLCNDASTKRIRVKEAMILYRDKSDDAHQLYVHDALITRLGVVKGAYSTSEYNGRDYNKLILLDVKNEKDLQGNFELDEVYYGKGRPPEINTPAFIKAQKAEIDFTSKAFTKVTYPGKEEPKIGKIKDGVYDLENVVINITETSEAIPTHGHRSEFGSGMYIFGLGFGGALEMLATYFLLNWNEHNNTVAHIKDPQNCAYFLGIVFPALIGAYILGAGLYNFSNYLKYQKFINLYKPEFDISFIGLLAKESSTVKRRGRGRR